MKKQLRNKTCGQCKFFTGCYQISNVIMNIETIEKEDVDDAMTIPACRKFKEGGKHNDKTNSGF